MEFKDTLKIGIIFLIISFILFLPVLLYELTSHHSITSFLYDYLPFLIEIPLFFLIIFYFLFKYQKEEYCNKSMFYKLPLIGAIFGTLPMFIFTIFKSSFCSGEECIGILVSFFIIPIFAIVLAIIVLILTFNAWYRTNLYIVAFTMLFFGVISFLIQFSLNDFWILYLEPDTYILVYLLSILFGMIIGTILSIIIKKFSEEDLKRVIELGKIAFFIYIMLFLAFIIDNYNILKIEFFRAVMSQKIKQLLLVLGIGTLFVVVIIVIYLIYLKMKNSMSKARTSESKT